MKFVVDQAFSGPSNNDPKTVGIIKGDCQKMLLAIDFRDFSPFVRGEIEM